MPLQNNPYKLTSQVSLAPDPQLASMMEHYKGSGDAVSFSVVFNEVQRRKEIRDAAQSKMSGGAKQKVADQLIQEAKQAQMPAPPQGQPQGGPPQGGPPQGGPPQGGPPQGGPPQGGPPQGGPPQGGPPPDMGMGPQGGPPQEGGPPPDMAMGPQEGGPPQGMADGGYLLPEDTGIAQLPARNLENMAGGGLVSFAYGGDIPGYAGDEGSDIDGDEELDDNYPRLSSRESDDNSYEKIAEELRRKSEREIREYGEQRKALGPAYANAEERDKEMTQRYADEERSLKGLPWIIGGAALMQSRQRGLGGLGEAVTAALPQYLSGRKELSALKNKQRDYMQTVAEARRAESLGNLDKMRELTASMDKQRLDIAGTSEQLKLNRDELGIKRLTANAKGSSGKRTPQNVMADYMEAEEAYKQAAQSEKDPVKKQHYLEKAAYYAKLQQEKAPYATAYGSTPVGFNQAQLDEYWSRNQLKLDNLKAQLSSPKQSTRDMATREIEGLARGSGNYEGFMARVYGREGGSASGGGGGGSNDPVGLR